ncbi:MAG: cobalamin-independent methionine synthase II family protein [Stellaceae bacterium]
MKRSEDRILTTHVGSIIRPPELQAAANVAREYPAAHAAYDGMVQAAVAEVVKKQAAAGIDIVNDGEFGKASWAAYIMNRLSGFEIHPEKLRPLVWIGRERERFRGFYEAEMDRVFTGAPTQVCVGPVAYTGQELIGRDTANLKAAGTGVSGITEMFITAVAPASTAYDGVNEYYSNEHDYVFAIADALRQEYRAIYEAGFLVQIDDALLTNYYDYLTAISPQRYRDWAELCIAALNHALEGIPEDRIRYHICFGSWHVPHTTDAPLEDIIDIVLKVRAGAYSIEAANPRHEHEWRVWEKVKLPPGKILIPGVVTHHTTTVEHPRLVADRIVRYAKLVGRENVIAGTDCGFAQVERIQRTHPEVMWAKYETLAEGARLASKELWGK